MGEIKVLKGWCGCYRNTGDEKSDNLKTNVLINV